MFGNLTSLKFELSAQNVHQQLHHRVHGREGVRKKDKPNDDGKFFVKAEGLVEGAVVDKDGKKGENVECVELEKSEVDLLSSWAVADLCNPK